LNETITVEELLNNRCKFLLSYPEHNNSIVEEILEEIKSLGIKAIELEGPHTLNGIPILGKGHVGIVVKAIKGSKPVALKIRRVDADRLTLKSEAHYLKLANSVEVGPKLLGNSDNLILMELIDGKYLAEWVENLENFQKEVLKNVLKNLIEKAYRLDVIGLDHGELSKANRHIMMKKGQPRIIDFESASTNRRRSNVTSITQYLFFNKKIANQIWRIIKPPEKNILIAALTEYKSTPSKASLLKINKALGLV
jgi:putative serine/threonine protein kinase